MGLSAVSELPEVSTINDQDLLMVSHTDDGVNYTSNKLTYAALKSAVEGGSGSDDDDIAQTLKRVTFYQLGPQLSVRIASGSSIQLNTICMVSMAYSKAVSINGIPCEKFNAYSSFMSINTTNSEEWYTRYIAYEGDEIAASSSRSVYIAPFLNIASESIADSSDVIYNATLNFADFYSKFKSKTLSTYSTLFDKLNIDYDKSRTTTYGSDQYFSRFQISCSIDNEYNVTIVPSSPTKVYQYDTRTLKTTGNPKKFSITTNKSYIRFPYTGLTYRCWKMSDINFTITICKVYTDITTS